MPRRQVDVCLVDNDDTFKPFYDFHHLVAIQRVTCRIVGRTEPDNFGVGIAGVKQFVCIQRETIVEQNLAAFNIVNVCTNLVHAVGGCYAHYVVASRFTEDAIRKINGLVATVA